MSNTLAKKAFAVASSSALVLASFASFATATVHTAGTNVSVNGTVYFIDPSGVRRGYTSGGAFLSYGFNSWAQVVPASAEDLALPVGSFVPPMDGSLINDMGTIYVINNGQRAGITTMAVFNGLGYQLSNVMVGDTSFMTSSQILSNSSMQHPVGALVNQNGTIYLITTSGKMGIPSESVFNTWGYSFAKTVPANAADNAVPMSSGIMQARVMGQLNPTGAAGGVTIPPVTPSGPLSVSAAYDMPASGTIVSGQATADLAHFTFSGNGTLNSVTLQRTGVSSNTALTNVYLYSGATRVADGASVNQNGVITFGGLNLAVNGSVTLAVKADIAATGTAGQTVGVQLTGYAVTGGSNNATSISGNIMTIASATLAGVSVGTQQTPSSSVNAGTTGFTLWSAPVVVNTRAVWLKSATFKYIGSAPVDAVANYRLYVNGTAAGSVGTINSLNNLTFDLTGSPVTLNTGSATLEVRGDIVKGSNRNITLSLQNAADLMVTDSQLNVNVAVVGPLTNSTTFAINTGGTITINSGSITTTIDPAFNAVTNVTGGAPGATIGSFKLTAYGEDVKVNSLSVTPALSGTTPSAAGLNNVSLFLNGSQVGSSQNWTSGALSFNLGSSVIVAAGTSSILQVRADLQTSANANYTAGTVTTTLNVGSSNAQGQNSLNTVNVPAAAITTTGLTITTGALSIAAAPGYAAQTVNGNQSNVKIGSYVIQNTSTSESVRFTNLAVALAFTAPTYTSGTLTTGTQTWTISSNAGITVGNVITPTTVTGGTSVMTVTSSTSTTVTGSVVQTGTPTSASGVLIGSGATVGPAVLTNISNLRTSESSGSGSTPINPSASNNFSVNFTLAPGATKTIDIMADLGTANFGTVTTTLLPTAIGASSNVVLTPGSATTGQVITLSAGALATPTLNSVSVGGTLAAQFIVGGSSPTVAQYNFVASNGAATITELKFTISGSATNPITQVCVSGQCAPVVGGIAYITGLNIAVPNNNAGSNVNVTPTFAAVGTNGVTSNTTAIMTLTYVKATIGGVTTVTTPSVAANTMTVVGTKPTVGLVQSTDTLLSGLVRVADVTVAADAAGDLKVTAIPINVTSSGVATVATGTNNVVVKDQSGNTIASTNGTFAVASNGSSGDVAINLTGGYLVPAGTTKTFSFYVTAATVSGATNTTSLTTKLGASSLFTWTDQVGGVAGITGALLYNYPTNTSNIHN